MGSNSRFSFILVQKVRKSPTPPLFDNQPSGVVENRKIDPRDFSKKFHQNTRFSPSHHQKNFWHLKFFFSAGKKFLKILKNFLTPHPWGAEKKIEKNFSKKIHQLGYFWPNFPKIAKFFEKLEVEKFRNFFFRFLKMGLFWGRMRENEKSPGEVHYPSLRPKTRLETWSKPFVPTPAHLRARGPKKGPKSRFSIFTGPAS